LTSNIDWPLRYRLVAGVVFKESKLLDKLSRKAGKFCDSKHPVLMVVVPSPGDKEIRTADGIVILSSLNLIDGM
jgi:hypothetical protein